MTISNTETLRNERAQLLARLRVVEQALADAQRAGSVEIRTHKNLRNSPCVATSIAEVQRWPDLVLVYEDESLTILANSQDHGGWVSAEAAAYLRSKELGYAVEVL